jgi:hypothetical protein
MKITKLRISTIPILSTILVATLLVTSCGLITDLKIALASSGPLVSLLVSKGLLKQDKADAITKDFKDAVNVADVLDKATKTATTTGQKLDAAQTAERAWVAIYKRGNFGSNQAIKTAADIADGIFASIVLFYGGQPASPSHVPRANRPRTEKELADSIKAQTQALKRALEAK